tara:strand:- start:509 stop:940 length:432 start_codon:yes stop_codon:yes gene_type:complete
MADKENLKDNSPNPKLGSKNEVASTQKPEAPKNLQLAAFLNFFRIYFIFMAAYVIAMMVWKGSQGVESGGGAKLMIGLIRGALEGMGCGYFVALIAGLVMASGYKSFPVVDGKYQIKWYNILLGVLGLVWFLFLTFILLGSFL